MVGIAMVYDIVRWEERDLIEKARSLGVDLVLIKVDENPFRVTGADVPRVEADVALQRCVSFYRALASTVLLEARGLKVVNSSTSIAIAADKLWTTAKLYEAGVPVPETIVGFSKQAAIKAAEMLGYPVVVKPILGSWGRLVARADDMDGLEAIIEHREYMSSPHYRIHYIQEYIRKPGRDIRVFVVGDEVPAAIYRVSNRWKTNTALGGKALSARVEPELEELALRAARAVGAEVAGLDVLEDPDRGFLVSEVNHNTEYRNTVRVTGVDLSSKILSYMVQVAKR